MKLSVMGFYSLLMICPDKYKVLRTIIPHRTQVPRSITKETYSKMMRMKKIIHPFGNKRIDPKLKIDCLEIITLHSQETQYSILNKFKIQE
jgi:hypothetical protein